MKPSDFAIRAATIDDAPLLVKLVLTAFAEFKDKLDPPSSAHGETEQKIVAKLGEYHALLALVSDQAVGCVFYVKKSDFMYLDRLSVLPDCRRMGIGTSLVKHVELLAASAGYSTVQLGVRIALPENKLYYEKLGYAYFESRTHAGYSEPTYILMRKEIPALR